MLLQLPPGFLLSSSVALSATTLRQQHARQQDLQTTQGPFDDAIPSLQWGQEPCLIRNAFDAPALINARIWPKWQDIIDLACSGKSGDNTSWRGDDATDDGDDEWFFDDGLDFVTSTGQSARLIHHVSGELDSFEADLGPFTKQDLEDISKDDENWSLLVNDVDRYRPALADWLDEQFGFLPRWRRDDAQISIAPTGGGIGPHVDSYDVFLIQTAGTREWRIQPTARVSVAEEMERLIPDLSVRILGQKDEDANKFISINMQPGDVLYLPPRVTHWGISTSDDCVTLSVGCRAPSAQEMVARLAEGILSSSQEAATQRYKEENLPTRPSSFHSIDQKVRARMKEMVLRAVEEAFENETVWDALVGQLVTEPKRLAETPTLNEKDYDYLDTWGSDANQVLTRVKSRSKTFLIRTPGISFATSRIDLPDGQYTDRLYANGDLFEASNDELAREIFHRIEHGLTLTCDHLVDDMSAELEETLIDLIGEGMIQADVS